ncbi:MAG: transposase [Candidatus Polarisedimenticolia bacterium]
MHWPGVAVEHQQDFTPPFCPRRRCSEHRCVDPSSYRFAPYGSYSTLKQSNIPRFRCLTCRKTFSRQSFATSYYLKRAELLVPIAAGLVAGSAHRQIARTLRCAPSTVTRQSARLGRHGLLLLARSLTQLAGRLNEPVVIDHFETFEFTQDYPLGIATAVGSESWFVYAIDPAPHRRAGRLSDEQKRRLKKRPERQLKGGYRKSAQRLFDVLCRLPGSAAGLELIGDGHQAYAQAAQRPAPPVIRLRSFPNPKRGPKGSPRSLSARLRDRAMFPVDVLHALVRHSVAHHRRETIAFGRRLNALMERFFLTAAWRNFVKGRSERKPDPQTPAMRLKLTDRPWLWGRVVCQRLFPDRESTPAPWDELYRRLWKTPLLGTNARHELKLAF